MLLRWIYNIWNFLLKFLSYLLLFLLLLGGLIVGGVQLPVSKSYISGQLVNAFNDQYKGSVSIGSMEGFIPFRTQLNDVQFFPPNSVNGTKTGTDTIQRHPLSVEELFISIDIWQLVRGNINITALDFISPDLTLHRDESGLNLVNLFARTSPSESGGQVGNFINEFSIFAPQISLTNGRVLVDETVHGINNFSLPDSLFFTDLNASFLVESNESQQFIQVNSFTASTNVEDFNEITFNTQLFTNGESLEVNWFDLRTESIVLELSADAAPVNVFAPEVQSQLMEASYSADFGRINIGAGILSRFDAPWLQFNQSVEFSGSIGGDLDTLNIDNIQLINGDSFLLADGVLTDIRGDQYAYDFSISNLVLNAANLRPFLPESRRDSIDLNKYNLTTVQGKITGTKNSLQAQLEMNSDLGRAELDTDFEFNGDQNFNVAASLDSLDLSPFLKDSIGTSVLNGNIVASGQGYDRAATAETTLQLGGSKIKTHIFQALDANVTYRENRGEYSVNILQDQALGSASGSFGTGNSYMLFMEASTQQLDITKYISDVPYDTAIFSGVLTLDATGTGLNDLSGRFKFDVNQSIINSDTLRAHNFYVDINNPGPGEPRELRLASSFLNLNATGTLYPEILAGASNHWYNYLAERINSELFFDQKINDLSLPGMYSNTALNDTVDISIDYEARDLQLLKVYLPAIPTINSAADIDISINASREKLNIDGTLFDDSLAVNGSSFDDLQLTLASEILYSESLKDGSVAELQISTPAMSVLDRYNVSGASINLSLQDSIITLRQQIDSALENLFYFGESTTKWTADRLSTTLDSLSIGSNQYAWHSIGTPQIIYRRDGAVTFDKVIMESNEDFFEIDGTFSNSFEDSVVYNIENFNLKRVSDLIGGRIAFEGLVNGEFTTRTLTDAPSISGDLSVDGGRINGRVVGDLTLQSRFNAEENRFDTEFRLYTDPEKYSDYLADNNGIGNDLNFEGYFKPPDQNNAEPDGNLVYFDADLREIDMWIVTFIVPNIIAEMEGSGEGSGNFVVDSSGYDFEANFEVEDVYGVPVFTNVPYTLGGELTFNRADGLLFEEVRLDDGRGGSGIFSGTVDLDDFSPINYLDLRMVIDDLRFMNNVQDPNVPFYADLTGTGTAVLDGTSQSPSLRSETPILLSSSSDISVPLMEQTELEQDRRFIQFVDSFDQRRPLQFGTSQNGTASEEEGEVDLSFVELFEMNLRFTTRDPVQVQLIFDPVTNDILSTRGTGDITLLLEDQDLSMYGRFNITGGQYQFVAGDIFTRRFEIQEGGAISWQGDLTDANLDVTASYRARPDISTLIPTSTNFQRIPIELILQIGGTISQIENDFFFQLPSGIEGTQDPTIAAQINRLNQNEEEKVLQAFGILLTGNFVPSDELQNPEFGNVTGTNTLVNPLVSSQIISPLLSNQINSLLRSDITFDVDFNLNAFNEVDLGVALRLFNDRIVLRREGQITGESEIGDLGATYRINQTFSITAFHRQDITLSNRSETESRQTQEMNGMGVEAQFQFNTWRNLKNRIVSSFRKFFGLKEDEPDIADDSQSLAEN